MNGLLPEGVRDFLFADTERRRSAEERLGYLFRRWGYRRVQVPSFEYLDTFRAAAEEEELIKFIDDRGRILALRPDMTPPLGRLAAGELAGEPRPLRLGYAGQVFRFHGPRRELRQVGVELVDYRGPAADAEVLALAVESLREVGCLDFRLGVGHLGFLAGIFAELSLAQPARRQILERLSRRDFVALEGLVAELAPGGHAGELLRELSVRQDREALRRLEGGLTQPAARQALEELQATFDLLEAYGAAEHCHLDLSLVRDFSYYTGLVFEGYLPGLGRPVLGGGRYDGLLAAFGQDWPAVGFALDLEEAVAAGEGGGGPALDYLLLPESQTVREAIVQAGELRRQGWSVEVAPAGLEPEAADRLARARGAARAVRVHDGVSPC
ncbi:MAG: ATP phosphoribosyltransferase regulatory subunit [Thermaerobacter sp.]|jgi:ATP phosphoribosyltransferase regulatory subunit|nr:ATP phosphoribosyltransferase regulatory subunit [Thermaerobacter sp.]MDA8145437.1 ATP phosphoribosyltransferase regulatory subunit [Thermaerobacter sp.]